MSEAGKANVAHGGKLRSAKAAAANQAAIATVQRLIEAEMKDNAGVYPHAKVLGITEVARRAGVKEGVLYKKHYAEFIESLRLWLKSMNRQEAPSPPTQDQSLPSTRRSLARRVEDWRIAYEALKDSHVMTELDLRAANERIEVLERRIAELQGRLSEQGALRLVSRSEA